MTIKPNSTQAAAQSESDGSWNSRIGGMALDNGVLLQSRHGWAAAIRDGSGRITTASGRTKGNLVSAGSRIPVGRGVGRLVEGLAAMASAKTRLPEARLPFEAPGVLPVIVLSTAAANAARFRGRSVLAQETASAVLSLIPLLLALRRSGLAGYHGAEHRTISAYAAGPGRPVGAQGFTGSAGGTEREHDRCGTNLVGPLVMANIAGNVLLRKATGRVSPGATAAVGALSVGGAMEFLRWASAHPRSRLARALLTPGRMLQRHLTTSEPSSLQMEVAASALRELIEVDPALAHGGSRGAEQVDRELDRTSVVGSAVRPPEI